MKDTQNPLVAECTHRLIDSAAMATIRDTCDIASGSTLTTKQLDTLVAKVLRHLAKTGWFAPPPAALSLERKDANP